MVVDLSDVAVVTAPSETYLNQRQLVDYREHRESLLRWLMALGKNPESGEGYSEAVVKNSAYRLDKFYREIWDKQGYTTNISHADADEYVLELATSDLTNSSKAKEVKAIKRLFKWKAHRQGGELWESEITFSEPDTTANPKDFLTKVERKKIREAALEYGSVPSYTSLTPQKRSRWKAYLAQRFSKPKSAVTKADWKRANGWKIPSLTWVSLDGGLRPIEVERAVVQWVDLENGVLRIPKEQSSKNRDNWIVGLRDQTTASLKRWLEQRETYPMYDDTDALWLTREENPYGTYALRYVLRRLCEIAGISTENRSMTWYSIRHSVGTYLSREEGLAAVQSQLRHKSIRTSAIYDNVPVEERKSALERIG